MSKHDTTSEGEFSSSSSSSSILGATVYKTVASSVDHNQSLTDNLERVLKELKIDELSANLKMALFGSDDPHFPCLMRDSSLQMNLPNDVLMKAVTNHPKCCIEYSDQVRLPVEHPEPPFPLRLEDFNMPDTTQSSARRRLLHAAALILRLAGCDPRSDPSPVIDYQRVYTWLAEFSSEITDESALLQIRATKQHHNLEACEREA